MRHLNSLNVIGHASGLKLKLISGVACAVGHIRDRSSAIFYTDLFALFKSHAAAAPIVLQYYGMASSKQYRVN